MRHLYLVGDIVDLWALTAQSFYWPQAHNDVIRTILGKAKHGTRVVYVPGNHDRTLRDHDGLVLGNVEIRREAVHETADGRRFLVLHGDEFDSIVRASPLLESIGSRAYAAALALNRYVNAVRPRFGYPYWSLAAFLKHKVKNAVKYIANFERALADEARRRDVDGVICGHIHRAEITRDRRHHLLQRRRLGRELHGPGGGLQRPAEPAALDRDAGPCCSVGRTFPLLDGAAAPDGRLHEDRARHRRLAATDQRRREDAVDNGRTLASRGHRRRT